MKKHLLFLYLITLSSSFLSSNEYSDIVYDSIEDITNPTIEDYKKVEDYLWYGRRPFLSKIDSKQYRIKAKRFRLLPNSSEFNSPDESNTDEFNTDEFNPDEFNPDEFNPDELNPDELNPDELNPDKLDFKIPHEIIPVNCNIEDKENCIVLYASCNYLYPESLLKLVERIKNSDFVGHIIYRIGGWPNVEEGDLRLAHIPYAFKVCAFREAYRLGYKRALWLDAPMHARTSFNTLFDSLKEMGLFTYYLPWSMADITKKKLHLSYLGMTLTEAQDTYTVSTGLLGIDFTNKTSLNLLDDWYVTTKDNEKASCTRMVETCLFSLVLNRYYKKEHFMDFAKHIYCPEHLNDKNRPTKENLHFVYTKQDVQPGWPHISY
ncbi:MAG: hypothetical protein S4CHLAM27_11350 [Chlamydiia bacterium]|nr:hypothetical protein [Chlamydiia bacterium]